MPSELYVPIGAVIAHYNKLDLLRATLGALASQTRPLSHVVVVDNSADATGDATTHMLATWSAAFGCSGEVVLSQGNAGYASAMNVGAQRLANRDPAPSLLLFLTHECVLEPDALSIMVESVTSRRNTIVGPGLNWLSDPARPWSRGGLLTGYSKRARHRTSPVVRDLIPSDWLDGACLLMRRSDWDDLGGFPEEYFLYYEEVALLLHASASGFAILCDTRALAFQEPGAPFPYLLARNGIYLRRKEFGGGVAAAWALEELVRLAVRVALRRAPAKHVLSYVSGIYAGLAGRMGRPESQT